jgi:hypothetical protein
MVCGPDGDRPGARSRALVRRAVLEPGQCPGLLCQTLDDHHVEIGGT